MKNRAGAHSRLAPRYMEAMLAKAGGLVAPDANSTLRVTYGQVKGVDAKDGLYYKPQTTLAGIVQKHTGEGDFDAPKVQLDAIQALRAGKKTPYLDPSLRGRPGQLPLDRGHHRRQFRIPDPERQGRVSRPAVRRHLRVRRVQLPVRPGHYPLHSCGQPLHAVEHGRGGRRAESTRGDVDRARNIGAFFVSGQGCRDILGRARK